MVDIEARWLSQDDSGSGMYGIIIGPSKLKPIPPEQPEVEERLDEFRRWQRILPQLDVPPPSFIGHVLGFEKDSVKFGSMHVRFFTRQATGMATAQILGIYTVDNNYRKVGITRSSMLRQMMEEFLRQAKEHKTQSVEIEKVDAEDEDLTMILKELDFARYQTTYAMRRTI